MNNLLVNIILICIFLCFSAFFSGMEAAVFSISRFRLKTLLFEKRKGATTLDRIRKNPSRTLATILLSNLLVNVGASSVGAIILLNLIQRYQLDTTISFITEFILMTSVILIFGEIAPKTIAIANAESLALRFSRLVEFLSWFFSPVSYGMEAVMHSVLGHRIVARPDTISDNEIKLMLSEAQRFNVLDKGEEEFGFQILKFGKMTVGQIMTPRQKVIGIQATEGLEQARRVITEEKHSRICVFDNKGEVVGVLYAKDLFRHSIGRQQTCAFVKDMMRELYVVPETKHVDNLLGEFRKKGIHIGMVVDEFGNFTGIVTLEDILESLFGEIIDEYDEVTDLPYERVDANNFLFQGDINIGELVRIVQVEPFAEEGERLSGYILSHFGRMPKENERIEVAGIELTIEEIHDRIIEKVRVRKL